MEETTFCGRSHEINDCSSSRNHRITGTDHQVQTSSGSVNDDFSHYHRSRCRNAPYHDFRHGKKRVLEKYFRALHSGRSLAPCLRNPGSKRWRAEIAETLDP